ncbi:hypothetical protein Tco_0180456 [Tanacetum coccineum]
MMEMKQAPDMSILKKYSDVLRDDSPEILCDRQNFKEIRLKKKPQERASSLSKSYKCLDESAEVKRMSIKHRIIKETGGVSGLANRVDGAGRQVHNAHAP